MDIFAKNHEKLVFDGIGGVVKRLAANASLQRPLSGQILNCNNLCNFFICNINGIIFNKIVLHLKVLKKTNAKLKSIY